MRAPQDKLSPERDGSGPSGLRVAVIGAGAAGLVAADELRRLGYQHVTVYEEEGRAGGKTLSHPNPAGGVWELGTVWLSEGYDVMDELASRFNVSLNVDRRPLRFLPTASPSDEHQEVHAFFPYALLRYSVVEVVGSVLHFWKIVHAHPFLKQPGFQVSSLICTVVFFGDNSEQPSSLGPVIVGTLSSHVTMQTKGVCTPSSDLCAALIENRTPIPPSSRPLPTSCASTQRWSHWPMLSVPCGRAVATPTMRPCRRCI